jgi:hypothetical protein
MSRRPIARSADLLRLQNEGYDLDIRGGYLLVRSVPYVNAGGVVRYDGILISSLEMSGDITNQPRDHVAYWTGEHPCHSDGQKITSIENGSAAQTFGDGVQADFTFSAKAAYRDYHHKITTYLGRIVGEATKLDPDATAQTFPAIHADDGENVFKYVDTATSRAGIGMVNEKLSGQKIGIIGLGGTGSYILDFVAKTPVAEIHLVDGDVFSQHNAFRSPGAPGHEVLEQRQKKVSYFGEIYSRMRNGIIVHDAYMDGTNLALLDSLDFVFLCADRGPIKAEIVARLVANGTPFVEVGMGILLVDGSLGGIVRTTTSTKETRDLAAPHISYADDDGGANEYASNIQIAELNALNAAIAVIQWKKYFRFYQDMREQYNTGFSIGSGEIIYDEKNGEN